MARFELPAVDTALKAARHQGSGRETEYRIVGNAGLIFVVQRSGRQSWRYYYSLGTKGRLKRKVSLGTYSAIGLAKARAKAAALDVRVAQEGDVVAIDRANAISNERMARTFEQLLDEYVRARTYVRASCSERASSKSAALVDNSEAT